MRLALLHAPKISIQSVFFFFLFFFFFIILDQLLLISPFLNSWTTNGLFSPTDARTFSQILSRQNAFSVLGRSNARGTQSATSGQIFLSPFPCPMSAIVLVQSPPSFRLVPFSGTICMPSSLRHPGVAYSSFEGSVCFLHNGIP